DNRNIMGAQKILLSIISGVEAELQMDELTEITEYIQEQAGEDAEMIFGHGVDPDLGDRIRVTVIATGFNNGSEGKSAKKEDVKKVHDLDRSQGWLFSPDNAANAIKDIQLKKEVELKRTTTEEDSSPRTTMFTGPFNRIDQTPPPVFETEDDGEESLFQEDDFDDVTTQYGD